MIPATLLLAEQRQCANGHWASVLRFGKGLIQPRRTRDIGYCHECIYAQRRIARGMPARPRRRKS